MSRRRILSLAAILLVAGAVAYVARPAGHIPPYDANLVRLAESQLEGYCAGETFWASGGQPDGNARMAATCRAQRAGTMSAEPKLAAVPPAFCQAIVDAGWDGWVEKCLEIVAAEELWPTYDGGISDQWNRARPYPVTPLRVGETEPDESRTGGRPDVPRSSPTRPDAYPYPYAP